MSHARGICWLLLLLPPLTAASEPTGTLEPTGTARVDYRSGQLVVQLETGLREQTSFATARLEAGRLVDRELPRFIVAAALQLQIDSSHVLAELVRTDLALFTAVQGWASRIVATSSLSPELGVLVSTAGPLLYGATGVARLLITHQQPNPPPRVLGFSPTRRYSGLVIYAADSYPAVGKPDEARVRPALFPRILDEALRVIAEVAMMDPVALHRWGVVAYAESFDEAPFQDRIGPQPLRTMARRVYGRDDTDIVIPTTAVRSLLVNPENAALIREGRILVIVSSATVALAQVVP